MGNLLEYFMFETSLFLRGFDDDLTNTMSFTNVIAYLDHNVIKVGTGARILQARSITW